MKKLIVLILLLMGVIIIFVRFVIGGSEDAWICQNGVWVKHGNPGSQKPEEGCGPAIVQKAKEQLEDSSVCYSPDGNSMNFTAAEEKASIGCKDGKLQANHTCNSTTGTWWIDFLPDSPKEGCYPACVVFVDTGAAEINWRCTGLRDPSI